jgi:hypothetical protein
MAPERAQEAVAETGMPQDAAAEELSALQDIRLANHALRNALFVIRGHIEILERHEDRRVTPAVLDRLQRACVSIEARSDEIAAGIHRLYRRSSPPPSVEA